jgi:hypothetical protein
MLAKQDGVLLAAQPTLEATAPSALGCIGDPAFVRGQELRYTRFIRRCG